MREKQRRANHIIVRRVLQSIYPPSKEDAETDSVKAYYQAKSYILENKCYGDYFVKIDDCFGSRPIALDSREWLDKVLPNVKKDSLFWNAIIAVLKVKDKNNLSLEEQYLVYYFYYRLGTVRNFQQTKDGYTFSIPVETESPIDSNSISQKIKGYSRHLEEWRWFTFNGLLKWEKGVELSSIEQREYNPCPVCFSPETPLTTPLGEVAITKLRIGEEIYSLDENNEPIIVKIRAKDSIAVGNSHYVLAIAYENGDKIYVSPHHPDAKNIPVMLWKEGEVKDNQLIRKIQTLHYEHSHTYDVLPDSESRAYLVKGVWMKSTLFREN